MGLVRKEVADYALAHTTALDAGLEAIVNGTRRDARSPGMMSGVVQARVLEMLIVATDARTVLEIGTFTGFGALAMAAALGPGGRIITIEHDDDTAALARANIDASPYGDRVQLITGDAREAIADLPGPFDVVYLDAWKRDYIHYYEAVLPKLAARGVVIADNVLWGGSVLEPSAGDGEANAMAAFNVHVQADERTTNTVLSVGDGLLLAWRNQSYGSPA